MKIRSCFVSNSSSSSFILDITKVSEELLKEIKEHFNELEEKNYNSLFSEYCEGSLYIKDDKEWILNYHNSKLKEFEKLCNNWGIMKYMKWE